MALITSNGTGGGFADLGTTWAGGSVPAAGFDYIDIAAGDVVTYRADTVVGDGANATVLSVAALAAQLIISGCTLTVRGNADIGAYHSGTVGDYVILNPVGTTPAILEFFGTATAPVITTEPDTRLVSNGTSSAQNIVRTAAGSAGNAHFTNAGNSRSGYWLATYTTFSKLGAAGTPGILSTQLDGGTAFATNPTHFTLSFTHCLFDSCGQTPAATTATDGSGIWVFDHCTWQNTLETDLTVGCMSVNMNQFPLISPGVRSFANCLFFSRPVWAGPRDFAITNCYFGDALSAGNNLNVWASCDGCYFDRATDDAIELQLNGGVTNSYFYTAQHAAGEAYLMPSGGSTALFSGNVAEYAGTLLALYWLGETEEPHAADLACTFTYNVVFNSGTGSWGPVANLNSNTSINPNHNNTIALHNTFITNGYHPLEGSSTTGFDGSPVQQVKSNIFVNTGASTGIYVFHNNTTAPATLAVDQAVASGILANAWKGFATVAGNPFGPSGLNVAGDTNVENGTPYYSPFSGATVPGSGDLASTDPSFADATRTLATWAGTVSGPATVANARVLLQATPTLVTSSLLPYVRAGYAPTNAALHNTAHDGTDIGAVAFASASNPATFPWSWDSDPLPSRLPPRPVAY